MHKSLTEEIVVVKRSDLFNDLIPWQGIDQENIDKVLTNIVTHYQSIQRSYAEVDTTFKQIVSYVIFTFDGKLFVMERKNNGNEATLSNKLSIGIGGHLRIDDLQGETLFDWVAREFEEEVQYQGNLKMHTIGFLNDDSNEVGQRHLGLIILLQGDHGKISIKSDEHKTGNLMSMESCFENFDLFESWSQIVLQTLV